MSNFIQVTSKGNKTYIRKDVIDGIIQDPEDRGVWIKVRDSNADLWDNTLEDILQQMGENDE